MAKQILITGATGLVGKSLVSSLQKSGYQLSILSRKQKSIKDVKVYDVLGRLIDNKQNVNSLSVSLNNIIKTNSALIIYVTLESGKQVIRKVLH